jgi:hypothetical protein
VRKHLTRCVRTECLPTALGSILFTAAMAEAQARTGYLLTTDQTLIVFDIDNPAESKALMPIDGVSAHEVLVGIDVRPENGLLYADGANGHFVGRIVGEYLEAGLGVRRYQVVDAHVQWRIPAGDAIGERAQREQHPDPRDAREIEMSRMPPNPPRGRGDIDVMPFDQRRLWQDAIQGSHTNVPIATVMLSIRAAA